MCVIYACSSAVPDAEELARGAAQNGHGAGLAWVTDNKVCWKKGFTSNAEEILAYIKGNKIPFPLMIHFRTASVGGQCPDLTHPFPLDTGIPLNLEGASEEGVLMHNGHLGAWEDWTLRAGLAAGEDFPIGAWSDSRALAWLVRLRGPGVLKFIAGSSRVALLYPDKPDATDPWSHFHLHGEWEDADEDVQGWLQSTSTRSYHKATNSQWTHPEHALVRVLGPDDSQENIKCVTPRQALPNIWTVEELNIVMQQLNKELDDARGATGIS